MVSMAHVYKLILAGILLLSNHAVASESLIKAKLHICSACHGADGISPNPLNPNLASQDTEYIISQLKAFKSGSRKNKIMAEIAKSLTDAEMVALANFYSDLSPEYISSKVLLKNKGKEKYSLCWGCHGEQGEGPGSYPKISGQHSKYTVQQLKNFKSGSRINAAMQAIVANLSPDDMETLGAYIATFKPQ